jgi:hypothetical protein
MQISENSWHFKLNNLYDRNVIGYLKQGCNVTLCEYFWATVWSLICLIGSCVKWVGISIVCLVVFWLLVGNPLSTLIQLHSGWIVSGVDELQLGLIILYLDLVIVTLIGILLAKDGHMKVFPKWLPIPKLWNWITDKASSQPKQVKSEPNLVLEFLKAKKQKICPLIKLKSE